MRAALHKIALLFPPIRRLLDERNYLRQHVAAQRDLWSSHRPYATLNASPEISNATPVDDKKIVARLLKAYQRAVTENLSKESMWREIFELHHSEVHNIFMSGNIEKASQVLANPATNNLFVGFDELCVKMVHDLHSRAKELADKSQDSLIRLGEAIGVFALENPEQGSWITSREISTNEILDEVEKALGVKVLFPDIYAGTVGAKSRRGIVTCRAVQALYMAFRISQIRSELTETNSEFKICEIGAGLGRSALFAYQVGIQNITLVDIPSTMISQGYYLMRCLGEDAVALPGETRGSSARIQILHPEDFFANPTEYDLVLNSDSITEFGPKLASRYLNHIAKVSDHFLSINHEANAIRVYDLLKNLGIPYTQSRNPSWMRNGYVEELVRFH